MVVQLVDEEAIFKVAVEIPADDARSVYLQQVCGNDRALLDRVLALLRVNSEAHDFLESPPAAFAATASMTAFTATPGEIIGPYKLRELLGEGGMGSVFVAEQEQPVRRKVALKLIKPGMDSRQVLSRFEAERQAVALMDHPNIARVLDAGMTDSGRPYFVMELVRGVPITEFCDQRRLAPRQRLELFVQVCRAIQHAHQKGVIHRDIKPSNILVTLHDDLAVPKVIDFGIAKATGQQLTEHSVYTAFNQLVGTPLYMSPEQAEMNALDVDTRSDVYSLGVLLYELLTGNTPFDDETFRQAGFDEMRRLIREVDPLRPSQRVSTLGAEAASTVSQSRGVDQRRLHRVLRGDLDSIVMKALEKDRNRRYESASALAADVQRHLDGEQIEARPPRLFAGVRKWCRRHRAPVASFAIFVLLAAIASSVSAFLLAEERDKTAAALEASEAQKEQLEISSQLLERERQRTETNLQQARDAIDKMFTRVANDLADKPHMEQIRRRLLEDALEFYQGFLSQKGDDLAIRHETALAYMRVGDIYNSLGKYTEALEPLEQSRAMFEELVRQNSADQQYRLELAHAHEAISYSILWLQRPDERLANRRKALTVYEDLHRQFPKNAEYLRMVADGLRGVAMALLEAGQATKSIDEFKKSLAIYEKSQRDFPDLPEDKSWLALYHHWLGRSLRASGRLVEAEQAYRASHDFRVQLLAEQPRDVIGKHQLAHIKSYLAVLLQATGRAEQALELLEQAIAFDEECLDDFPDNADYIRRTAVDYGVMSRTLMDLGRIGDAEAALRRSEMLDDRLVEDGTRPVSVRHRLAWKNYNLGVRFEAKGQHEKSAELIRKAIDAFEQLTVEHPKVTTNLNDLAWVLATCPATQFRDPGRAVKLANEALKLAPSSAQHWGLLGVAQYRAGDFAAAIETLETAEKLIDEDVTSWLFLAMAHRQVGDPAKARQWYDKSRAWLDKNRSTEEDLNRFRVEATRLLKADQDDEEHEPNDTKSD